MKLLTVSALLCAVMALTTAARVKIAACPCGWTVLNGDCSIFVSTPKNYADAQMHCQSMGANLPSVHSDAEYKALQKFIFNASGKNTQVWLGGSDGQQEGTWFWNDGTPFDYKNWCPGLPDNYGGKQHCLWMNWGGYGCLGWDDIGCETQMASVCIREN